jgi:transcriptional regulator with XRE-family HTH domain
MLLINSQIEDRKTTGIRLRAWRKNVPLKLMQLSKLIKVSQGSFSDLENDTSMPSATTLANLLTYTDFNIFWLLTENSPVSRQMVPEIKKIY